MTSKQLERWGALILFFFVLGLAPGCATNIRRASGPPQSPTVKFSSFDTVTLKHIEIAPAFASAPANQKAGKKIDELLFMEMQKVFADLRDNAEAPAQRGLLIEPLIEEIKFIGGAARFWVGSMAGSSAVLMKVTYRDVATGEVIADPEFYQSASAFQGSFSVGVADNRMLSAIASEIASYTGLNR